MCPKRPINTATCTFKLQEQKQTNLHGSHGECTSALCNFSRTSRADIGGVLRAKTREHMHTSARCKCGRIANIACCTCEKQKLMYAHHSCVTLVRCIWAHRFPSKPKPLSVLTFLQKKDIFVHHPTYSTYTNIYVFPLGLDLPVVHNKKGYSFTFLKPLDY